MLGGQDNISATKKIEVDSEAFLTFPLSAFFGYWNLFTSVFDTYAW
jgi:hypothetical protein